MAETEREIERKYEGPAEGFDLPDLTPVPGVSAVLDQGVVELDAVYYDTADQRLAAHRITLRRRTGGADAGWHLKLPVAPGVRDEIRAPLDAEPDAEPPAEPLGADAPAPVPPAELTALVRSRTRAAPLLPLIRLRSARHLSRLVDDTGALLAEACVDHVRARRLTGPDGAGATAEWTEAEVELAAGGSPAFLDTVEPRLTEAGLRPSESPSKLVRALRETSTGPPEAPAPRPPKPPKAAAHVLAYLRTQRDTLVDLDPAVRRDLPDAVHRMRVATRRLRSALRSYRTILDRSATRPTGAELKWLAAELGAGRDQEVLAERLTAGLEELPPDLCTGPVRERLRHWAEESGGGAQRRVVAALDSDRYLALLAALDTLLAAPPLRKAADQPSRKVLGTAVRRECRRLDGLFDEALRRPPGEARDAALHETRKAAKRLRYAAEAATPALGPRARRTVTRAKDLQTVLGDHQDSVMARRTLRDLAAEADAAGESTFTYGLLYGREERRAAAQEARLTAARPG